MPDRESVTFQEAIDIVESLPERQQQDIVDILQHRLIDRRRESLIKSVRKAEKEYSRGEVKAGSVDDIMKALS
jgi:hypothetical protein